MKREKKQLDNIQCDVCGYYNHKDFVDKTGTCHLCGKVLDDKAYFKQQMNKKLRLWRNAKWRDWN